MVESRRPDERRSRVLYLSGFFAVCILVLTTASQAFACGTFRGKVTLTVGGTSSVAQGDDNCGHTGGCGLPNGSMTWCGPITFGAHTPHNLGASATLTVKTTDVCAADRGTTENALVPNATYGINWVNANAMTSTDTVIDTSESCISLFGSVQHILTVTSDASGHVTATFNMPSSATANTNGWSTGFCIADANGDYGNELPVQFT